MPLTKIEFAKRLKQLRDGQRWSQDELAVRIGVHQTTVSAWENLEMERSPSVPELLDLCAIFDTSADWLLGRSDFQHGLAPDMWIIDEAELEKPTPEGTWSVKIPRRMRIVDYEEFRRIERAVEERRLGAPPNGDTQLG